MRARGFRNFNELMFGRNLAPPIDWECGGAVVRTPALESQGCEFDSNWVSTLATLGKLLT